MIAILDYGSGNIRSAQRACERVGLDTKVTSDPKIASEALGLVVPGVGAFSSCVEQLRAIGGDDLIRERANSGRPVLGICVGMQILFEDSEEGGKGSLPGLGLIPGKIKRLPASILPQMGWNQVKATAGSKLFRGLVDESFYFVHSYGLIKPPAEAEYATSDYQGEFVAAVEIGGLSAVQFHPEKSGPAGLRLLANWAQTL